MSGSLQRPQRPPQGGLEESDGEDDYDAKFKLYENHLESLNTRINTLTERYEESKTSTEKALNAVLQRIEECFSNLRGTEKGPEAMFTEPARQPTPSILQGQFSSEDLVNTALNKELTKKASQIPIAYRLQGTENYDQWLQALTIMFRAIGIPSFIANPSIGKTFSDKDQAVLLSLLRDSLLEGPQALIAWESDPTSAFLTLKSQYSMAPDIQRGYLYQEFHSLNYSEFQGTLPEFNAKFNSFLAKLALAQVKIAPIDQVNRYLQALEKVFPVWTERVRGNIRQFRAIGQPYAGLNLQWLMADISEEQRNPASSSAKSLLNMAKQGPKWPKKEDTPQKDPPNEGKKPAYKKQNPQGKKDPKKKENNVKKVAEDYVCGLNDYSFTSEEGVLKDLSTYPPYDSEDSEDEDQALLTSKRPDIVVKPQGVKTTKNDTLLYDTGATVHIANDMKWFTEYRPIKNPKAITTVGGTVTPTGIGTTVWPVLAATNPDVYVKLTCKNTMFIPSSDINIFSGVKHYAEGGCLSKNTLYGSNQKIFGLLNHKNSSFFFTLQKSKAQNLHYNSVDKSYIYSSQSPSNLPKEELVIELDPLPKAVRDHYPPIS
jgi:hypothetical protein